DREIHTVAICSAARIVFALRAGNRKAPENALCPTVSLEEGREAAWNDLCADCFLYGKFTEEKVMKSQSDIFEHTLQDVYYAENAITKALPKVAKAAKSSELKKAAEDHLSETKGQITKLEQVFKSIGKKASGEKCDSIEGL